MTRLRDGARDAAVTEFTLLLTVLVGALSRVTGQCDLVSGTPVSGRQQSDLADVAGYFVNVVPLRFRWCRGSAMAGLFGVVRDALPMAWRTRTSRWTRFVAAVEKGRSPSGIPLVDLLFSLEDRPPVADVLDGLRTETVPLQAVAAKVDLHCAAERDASGLTLRWNYRSDAVDGAEVRAFAETFPRVLRDLLARPGLRSRPPTPAATRTRRRHPARPRWNRCQTAPCHPARGRGAARHPAGRPAETFDRAGVGRAARAATPNGSAGSTTSSPSAATASSPPGPPPG